MPPPPSFQKNKNKSFGMGNTRIYAGVTALYFLFLMFCLSGRNPDHPAETAKSSNRGKCYGYENNGGACLGDCDCGGCGRDGCMPGNCDGPTRPEDTDKCDGNWNHGFSCPCGGAQRSGRCSDFDGYPKGCRDSCQCGYCSPLGCTEGGADGPFSGKCDNPSSWQFFGPC